eukprot:SAG11_NODE_32827_length_280_cov_1.165746_1_plen_40_part_01
MSRTSLLPEPQAEASQRSDGHTGKPKLGVTETTFTLVNGI